MSHCPGARGHKRPLVCKSKVMAGQMRTMKEIAGNLGGIFRNNRRESKGLRYILNLSRNPQIFSK